MLLKSELRIGDTYAWNIDGLIKDLYPDTTTVTLLEIEGKLLTVESHQTGECFTSHMTYIFTLERCRKMLAMCNGTKDLQKAKAKMISKLLEVNTILICSQGERL